MSRFLHLEKLKIGCVQYLNAKPLIHGYDGPVHFDHPARLAKLLSDGEIDVALVPIFELMRSPDYDVADGVSISAVGAVYSVFLAYRGDLKEVKTVSLDTASLTSVNLIRCILGEFHGLSPEYVAQEKCADETAAQLLIGNHAIDFRQTHGEEYRYLDLGEEWMKQTGLPFVFAVWLIRRDIIGAGAAAGELRKLKEHGIACIPEIVQNEKRYDADFEARYLTHYIRYDLGEPEKAGMVKFRELLLKQGLIAASEEPLVFL